MSIGIIYDKYNHHLSNINSNILVLCLMAGLLLFPFQTVAGWWHEEWNLPSKTLTVSVSFTQLMTFMLSHHLSGFLSHRGNTQDTVQGSIHIWSNLRKAKWQRHKNTTSSFTVPDYTALACMNMQQRGNVERMCNNKSEYLAANIHRSTLCHTPQKDKCCDNTLQFVFWNVWLYFTTWMCLFMIYCQCVPN